MVLHLKKIKKIVNDMKREFPEIKNIKIKTKNPSGYDGYKLSDFGYMTIFIRT